VDEEKLDIVKNDGNNPSEGQVENLMIEISELIQDGASTFLQTEYKYTGICIVIFAAVIAIAVEPEIGCFYTTGPFLLGATTSIVSGYIAM